MLNQQTFYFTGNFTSFSVFVVLHNTLMTYRREKEVRIGGWMNAYLDLLEHLSHGHM